MVHGKVGALREWFSEPPNKELGDIVFDLNVVYLNTALERSMSSLPGISLSKWLDASSDSFDRAQILQWKLAQACRKLSLMWQAAEGALEAEQEFYSSTCRYSKFLYGHDAVMVHYHLEAFVLFARSALDLSANVYGALLPSPFPRDRYDSFNKLIKTVDKGEGSPLRAYFEQLRADPVSWLSVLSGSERGRCLRDRISHQTEFPLDYAELHPHSEQQYEWFA